MQHKIKITPAQSKPIKITLTKIAPVDDDRPIYTDSDGRVFDRFDQMKPIKYEA